MSPGHLLRNALADVSWQDRRPVVAALKPLYQAPSADATLLALDAFEAALLQSAGKGARRTELG